MSQNATDPYILKTGKAGAARLQLLQDVYGETTQSILKKAGLKPGMSVFEVGCGTGQMSCWLAETVGPSGKVVGVDISPEQLEVAAQNAKARGIANTTFRQASAYETGLEDDTFDVAYVRCMLCHVQRPAEALQEMLRVLKPGGRLVCIDLDLTSLFTIPESPAYTRFNSLLMELGRTRGVDYCFGRKMHQVFQSLGVENVHVEMIQPAYLEGEGKRLWEYTYLEASPGMIDIGLIKQDEVESLSVELESYAKDPSSLVVFPRFPAVWGSKPD